MSHTKGKLTLFSKNGTTAILDENGNSVVGWMGFDMSERSKREHKANARHLVACWNALSDFSADLIEQDYFPGVLKSMRGERDLLKQERDGALAVLRKLAEWEGKYPGHHIFHLKELGGIVNEAKALLAKHKDKS